MFTCTDTIMNKILTTEDSSVVTASKLSKALDEVVVCVHKIACVGHKLGWS